MRIAVVGAGISGLVAAYLLHRDHDIQMFEAGDYIGGHTNTVEVKENGRTVPVDTGFIVFNSHNYPNLCRLFSILGIAGRCSDMSFSVSCEGSGLEYNGTSLNTLFAQRRNLANPRFLLMLKDILRFHHQAPACLRQGLSEQTTVEDYVQKHRFGAAFTERYLVPLGASLWSCPAGEFRRFPMQFVLEFLDNHCMLQANNRPQWMTVEGGSYRYIPALTNGFRDRIHLRHPVRRVRRSGKKVELVLAGGAVEEFDEVVLATHADQSLALLEQAESDEQALLAQFPYTRNEAVLHTDTTLLPRARRAWASWNYRIPAAAQQHVTVTYNMNRLQGIESARTYCVSLNRPDIAAGKIIRRIQYHHPRFSPGRAEAQARHRDFIRRRGISYCGAYWGFGFHEDGVRSALAVGQAFNKSLEQ